MGNGLPMEPRVGGSNTKHLIKLFLGEQNEACSLFSFAKTEGIIADRLRCLTNLGYMDGVGRMHDAA